MVRHVLNRQAVVFAALLLACAQQAAAQEALKPLDRPDPASVVVPDMSAAPDPDDASDYDTHFYFHKTGVSYQAAFADIDECRLYALTTKSLNRTPSFAPLGSDAIRERTTPIFLTFGILGDIVASFFVAQEQRDTDRATTKQCMAYKGYSRYGTSAAIWSNINSGSNPEKVARAALIASGPKPAAEAIDP